uniref:DNA-directed RNA polymerase n=1 Tax=Lygus hesperus TaxID=30085 RepID=A0A0A9Z0I2_LYGHE
MVPPSMMTSGSSALSKQSSSVLQAVQQLKYLISQVIVSGIPSISRAVINDTGNGTYNLLVEGYNMQAVMNINGVCGTQVTSNHILEIHQVLGIEAARQSIIHEIDSTMGSHGLTIDVRHSSLLADIMTYQGNVHGITRFGIAKMKDSVLMLASFEKTADHLFEAALKSSKDTVSGVSECIILGLPVPIGTGMFETLYTTNPTNLPAFQYFDKCSSQLTRRGKTFSATDVLASFDQSPSHLNNEFASRSPLLNIYSHSLGWDP